MNDNLTHREDLIISRIELLFAELYGEVAAGMSALQVLAALSAVVRPVALSAIAERDTLVLQ